MSSGVSMPILTSAMSRGQVFSPNRPWIALTTHYRDSTSLGGFSNISACETQLQQDFLYLGSTQWFTTADTLKILVPQMGYVRPSQSQNISLLSNDPGAVPTAITPSIKSWRPIGVQENCLPPALILQHVECLIFPAGNPPPTWLHQAMTTTINLAPPTKKQFTMKSSLPKHTVHQFF